MEIYLAGPVLPDPSLDAQEEQVLRIVTEAVERAGLELAVPIREAGLDALSPDQFVREIDRRLRDSDAVVSLIRAGDQSVPVESALASAHEKPQIVVAIDVEPPRLITGLPFVRDVVDGSSLDLGDRLSDFLAGVQS